MESGEGSPEKLLSLILNRINRNFFLNRKTVKNYVLKVSQLQAPICRSASVNYGIRRQYGQHGGQSPMVHPRTSRDVCLLKIQEGPQEDPAQRWVQTLSWRARWGCQQLHWPAYCTATMGSPTAWRCHIVKSMGWMCRDDMLLEKLKKGELGRWGPGMGHSNTESPNSSFSFLQVAKFIQ